jgi:hypothetical protein
MPVLTLLPSPLLGPAVWEPAADGLIRRGWDVATLPALPRPPTCAQDAVDACVAALPADRELVLVPHSNAGLYVDALAAVRRVERVVFVDAGLPSRSGATPMAPAALRRHLEGLADADGLLPPWTGWWPEQAIARLFPDARTRAVVESEQRRLPLGYFADAVPAPAPEPTTAAHPRATGAYLAFGDTYAEERGTAVQRGWPVETLAGEHLHQLVDPEAVAAAVIRLADRHSDGQLPPETGPRPG